MSLSDEHYALKIWLEKSAKQLNLQVTNYTWSEKWIPGYCDVGITIEVGKKIYVGRAGADSLDMALIKAAAEAIERTAITFNNLPTSNGLAAHFSDEIAMQFAKVELIERDQFFCHYLTKTKPQKIAIENLLSEDWLELISKLKNLDVKCEFFLMRKMGGLFSIICTAKGEKFKKPFGVIIGLGCSQFEKSAAQKSVQELMKNVMAIVELDEVRSMSLQSFLKLEKPSPKNHQALAMDLEYSRQISSFFPEGMPVQLQAKEEKMDYSNTWNFTKLSLSTELEGCPIKVYRAENPRFQNLYFGQTVRSSFNKQRLEEFYGHSLSDEDLQWLPHPLG